VLSTVHTSFTSKKHCKSHPFPMHDTISTYVFRALACINVLFFLLVIRVHGALLLSRHNICDGYWLDENVPNRGK